MILPESYVEKGVEAYLEACTELLASYEWVYNFQLTKFFTEKVWLNFPEEWQQPLLELSTDELNELPYGLLKEEWPESLKQFIVKTSELCLPRKKFHHTVMAAEEKATNLSQSLTKDKDMSRGMTPKKVHEVPNMAAIVDQVCQAEKCDVIVDVGSGLGYLGQVLDAHFDYKVISIESKDHHIHGAEARLARSEKRGNVEFHLLELQDTEECFKAFQDILAGNRKMCPCCMTRKQSISRLRRLSIGLTDGTLDEVEILGGTKSMEIGHAIEMINKGSVPEYFSSIGKGDALPDWIRFASTSDIQTLANNTQVLFRKSNSSTDLRRLVRSPRNSQNVSRNNSPYGTPISTPIMEKHPMFLSPQPKKNHNNNERLSPVDQEMLVERPHAPDTPGQGMERPMFLMEDVRPHDSPKIAKFQTPLEEETSDDDDSDIEDQVDSDLEDQACEKCSNVCLTGLHCCGDLAATMLRIFVSMKELRTLVCVSCCYHNMRVAGEHANFPMSLSLGAQMEVVRRNQPDWQLNIFAMRLAAQETRARWRNQTADDHTYHMKNVAYRAILEEYIQTETGFRKIRRKIARRGHYTDFNGYLDGILGRSRGLDTEDSRDVLWQIHDKYEPVFKFIEIITAMQVLLQPVLETLIVVDRALYLMESGVKVDVIPVFDEYVSPRNLALIGIKESSTTENSVS